MPAQYLQCTVIASTGKNVYTRTMTSVALPPIQQSTHVSLRWAPVLVATILLHLLVLHFADEQISLPRHAEKAEKTVEISLSPKPLEAKAEPAAPRPDLKPANEPVNKPAAKPANTAAIRPAPAVQAQMAMVAAADADTETPPEVLAAINDTPVLPMPAGVKTQAANSPGAEKTAAVTDAPAAAEKSEAEPTLQYSVAPPPSARLALELVNSKPGQAHPYFGEGEINWEVGNGRYRMTTKAGLVVLFTSVNLLTLRSEGVIDSHGIAPLTSSETRRGRSETATHFNREEKTITFSASTRTAVLSDGAQDKNTIIMQLAGIGNADPRQMQPGRQFAIQIGEDRDATVFQFIVQGQEQITTKLGSLATWHLVRPPRPGSYNSRLDIWLAPQLQWYPVQIRNTESNGAVTTQSVTRITPKTIQEN